MKPYANNPHHSVITLISHIITLAILMIISGCVNAKIDDKGNTKLHEMAGKCNLEEVNKLIAAGANINAKNNDGFTPLFKAVGCSSTNITKKLIDSGADVNAKNNDDFTVLTYAVVLASGGHREFLDNLKLLLEAGADVNVTFSDGKSALSFLMDFMDSINDKDINAFLETAKLLVAYGATGDEEATKKTKTIRRRSRS